MALIVTTDEDNNPVIVDDTTGQVVGTPTQQWQRGVNSIAPNLSTTIEQNQAVNEPWYVTAQKMATALIMTDQQRRLLNVQIDRAQKGLPPLDLTNYTGVGVRVGLSPQTQQLVIYGGLALLALLLFRSIRR